MAELEVEMGELHDLIERGRQLVKVCRTLCKQSSLMHKCLFAFYGLVVSALIIFIGFKFNWMTQSFQGELTPKVILAVVLFGSLHIVNLACRLNIPRLNHVLSIFAGILVAISICTVIYFINNEQMVQKYLFYAFGTCFSKMKNVPMATDQVCSPDFAEEYMANVTRQCPELVTSIDNAEKGGLYMDDHYINSWTVYSFLMSYGVMHISDLSLSVVIILFYKHVDRYLDKIEAALERVAAKDPTAIAA